MKKLTYSPVLVDVTELAPAVYNPREADGLRLEFLTQSIDKLGFVLPLYATKGGHLLSGHQRLTVAKKLGYKQVPVVWVNLPETKWKQVNLLFNRATNDMDVTDNSELYVNELDDLDLDSAIAQVESKVPDTPEAYPCMQHEWVPVADVTSSRVYSSHASAQCQRLLAMGVVMPIIMCRQTKKIVNGNYRFFALAEKMANAKTLEPSIPVVWVNEAEAHIAEALVNLISMKFTVEKQFGDVLRYGGYRRPENKVEDLVVCMRFWADGLRQKSAAKSLENSDEFWHRWRQVHGNTVADMGAGQMRNGIILRKKGIDCVDWEPYPCDWQKITGDKGDRPSLTLARKVSNDFLDRIEAGAKFESIFANAVINSIPFHKDRMCFFALVHAISSFHTGFYGTAKCIYGLRSQLSATLPLNKISAEGKVTKGIQQSKFQVPYEAGALLADISKAPKIQKYHTPEGLRQMLETFYSDVHVHYTQSSVYQFFSAHSPKRINPKVLRAALTQEFSMPYPDNQNIGLADRALRIFSIRHNVDLLDPRYAPSAVKAL